MAKVQKTEEERPLEDLTLDELKKRRWRLLHELSTIQELIHQKSEALAKANMMTIEEYLDIKKEEEKATQREAGGGKDDDR